MYLCQQVELIHRLLLFLPLCKNSKDRDNILQEIRSIRWKVSDIEEMTKTERQKDVKFRIMTIDSDFDIC